MVVRFLLRRRNQANGWVDPTIQPFLFVLRAANHLFDPRSLDGGRTTEDEWLPSSVFGLPSNAEQICDSLR
jgi:hypothetical protein